MPSTVKPVDQIISYGSILLLDDASIEMDDESGDEDSDIDSDDDIGVKKSAIKVTRRAQVSEELVCSRLVRSPDRADRRPYRVEPHGISVEAGREERSRSP